MAATTSTNAPDYIRTDDGATMREVFPGEFVNLAVLTDWGFKAPAASGTAETARTTRNSTLDRL